MSWNVQLIFQNTQNSHIVCNNMCILIRSYIYYNFRHHRLHSDYNIVRHYSLFLRCWIWYSSAEPRRRVCVLTALFHFLSVKIIFSSGPKKQFFEKNRYFIKSEFSTPTDMTAQPEHLQFPLVETDSITSSHISWFLVRKITALRFGSMGNVCAQRTLTKMIPPIQDRQLAAPLLMRQKV